MLLHPPVRFHNLLRISSGGEHLRNQRIRIQCDRCYQLLQLFPRLLRGLYRWLCGGLVRLSEPSRRRG